MTRKEYAERMGIGKPFEGTSGRLMSGKGWMACVARRLARMHYFSTIERYVARGCTVLDFGSGGGDHWLASNYRVTGLELAMGSAKASFRTYRRSLNADVRCIPVTSSAFDASVSSFVLEHLPMDTASAALSELHRSLKPGGVLISLCDLECDHPLLAWIRRTYPEGYREAFVENPGHLGLRSESAWRELLKNAGFRIDVWLLQSRLPILDHGPICQLAASSNFPAAIQMVGRMAFRFSRLPMVAPAWGVTVTFLDDLFRTVLPRAWAYRLLFVARK